MTSHRRPHSMSDPCAEVQDENGFAGVRVRGEYAFGRSCHAARRHQTQPPYSFTRSVSPSAGSLWLTPGPAPANDHLSCCSDALGPQVSHLGHAVLEVAVDLGYAAPPTMTPRRSAGMPPTSSPRPPSQRYLDTCTTFTRLTDIALLALPRT